MRVLCRRQGVGENCVIRQHCLCFCGEALAAAFATTFAASKSALLTRTLTLISSEEWAKGYANNSQICMLQLLPTRDCHPYHHVAVMGRVGSFTGERDHKASDSVG